jgi:hypothetical protein
MPAPMQESGPGFLVVVASALGATCSTVECAGCTVLAISSSPPAGVLLSCSAALPLKLLNM